MSSRRLGATLGSRTSPCPIAFAAYWSPTARRSRSACSGPRPSSASRRSRSMPRRTSSPCTASRPTRPIRSAGARGRSRPISTIDEVIRVAKEREGRRDPPRLRLPLGEPGIRRGLRRRRHRLHRPDARRPCARSATRWPRATSPSRSACPVMPATDAAARRSRATIKRLAAEVGYPVMLKASLGRRRARHAPDRRARSS